MRLCKFEKCTKLQAFVPHGVGSNWSSRRYLTAHILPKIGNNYENRCVFISGKYDINVGLLICGLLSTEYFHLWRVAPILVRAFRCDFFFSTPAPSRLLTCGTDSRTLKSGGFSILICDTDSRLWKAVDVSSKVWYRFSHFERRWIFSSKVWYRFSDLEMRWIFNSKVWYQFSDFERRRSVTSEMRYRLSEMVGFPLWHVVSIFGFSKVTDLHIW